MAHAIKNMKKTTLIFISLFLFIAISNLPPIHWFYKQNDCWFSNGNGSFTFAEMSFQGDDFQQCSHKFLEFRKRKLGDTVLYRLCSMNIFYFWDYGEYIFSQKYKVPYKSWKEIESRRDPMANKSGFQDF